MRQTGTHRHDFGALVGGTASLAAQCTHLEVPDGEMAVYRFTVTSTYEVEIKHPQAALYLVTRNPSTAVGANWRVRPWVEDSTIPRETAQYNWIASQFWVWEDDTPRFDLYPLLSQTVPAPQGHIEFFGFKYALEELPAGEPEPQVEIWIDRWPEG